MIELATVVHCTKCENQWVVSLDELQNDVLCPACGNFLVDTVKNVRKWFAWANDMPEEDVKVVSDQV